MSEYIPSYYKGEKTTSLIETFITVSKHPELEKKIRRLQGLPIGYVPPKSVWEDGVVYFESSRGGHIRIERIVTPDQEYAFDLLRRALLEPKQYISPHLSIYKFGINMLGSILHRIFGVLGIVSILVAMLFPPIWTFTLYQNKAYSYLIILFPLIIHIIYGLFIFSLVSHIWLSIYKYLFEKFYKSLSLLFIFDVLKISLMIEALFAIYSFLLFF